MAHHKLNRNRKYAQIAQLVEQGTENPRVLGSIPSLGTTYKKAADLIRCFVFTGLFPAMCFAGAFPDGCCSEWSFFYSSIPARSVFAAEHLPKSCEGLSQVE